MKNLSKIIPKDLFKYLAGIILVTIFRFIPRPPNFQPVMATMLPFSKQGGSSGGVLFGVLAVIIFDLSTGLIGSWTLVTAGTYALIGFAAGLYFKNRESKIRHYLVFSIMATVFYDLITGPVTGVLLFQQTFWFSLSGQIPFTLSHLAGNMILSCLLSPLVYRWISTNSLFEPAKVMTLFSPS